MLIFFYLMRIEVNFLLLCWGMEWKVIKIISVRFTPSKSASVSERLKLLNSLHWTRFKHILQIVEKLRLTGKGLSHLKW